MTRARVLIAAGAVLLVMSLFVNVPLHGVLGMATTAPALSTPKNVAANSSESYRPISTRSSGRTPRATSAFATWFESACSSA